MAKLRVGLIGIVGEEASKDFWGTMERVASTGYEGIEGGDELLRGDVAANVERFHAMGLRVLTTSASRESLRDRLDEHIRTAQALKTDRVTVWWGPCESKGQVLRDAELYEQAGARLAAEGLRLCYHNHEHEFRTAFDGVYALDLLAANTDPKHLYFEIDAAWVTFGGEDPAKVIRKMAGRIPSIHVKDLYDLSIRDRFTAVGTGLVNLPAAIEAAEQSGVEWMVVEQDRLRNLTAFETISLSFLYLKEQGFTA